MGFLACSIFHLFLVLQLQTLFVSSQNIINGSVPVGESLTASESRQFSGSWLSPSGDFAFGFRKIPSNDGFTLSIWFDKIPDKTIVWHAQAINTTTGLVPTGSKVTLTADRGLVLTNPGGQQLWSSSLPPSRSSVSRGLITDAGDFGLFSEDSGVALWSSFANPTDTLLPTQNMEAGRNLSSRLTETSFKKGRFRLSLGTDGDLQLLVLNSKTLAEADVYFSYYQSNTKDPNPGIRLVFNESGYMYVLRRNDSISYIKNEVPVSSRNFYHRAVVHFDGVFAQYYHLKGQGRSGWELAWAVPDNICRASSDLALGIVACGYNSICSLGGKQRPKCECPERFSLMDPSDEYGDCKPDFEMQTCGPENNKTANADVNLYEFIRVDRTNWPTGDYERYVNYDAESCRNACLNDCFCAAVVFGDGVCWKKRFPLIYGHRAPDGNGNGYTLIKFLKSAAVVPITERRGKTRDWLIIAGSVLLGTSAFVNFIILALYRKSKEMKKKSNQVRDIGDLEAIHDMETVERCVKIGIWCIQEDPGMRPNMRHVTQMLEGFTQVHDPPNPTPYNTFSRDKSMYNAQV
ncbi:unnamed protein product, partial [Thlaspi arvense]